MIIKILMIINDFFFKRNFDGKFLISREGKVIHVTTDNLESEIQRLLEISNDL